MYARMHIYIYIYLYAYVYVHVYTGTHIYMLTYIHKNVAVLNKSWRQHPTRLQLYGHLPPITKIYKLLLEKQGRAHKRCTPVDPHYIYIYIYRHSTGIYIYIYIYIYICSVGRECRIHRLHFCRRVRPTSNECP